MENVHDQTCPTNIVNMTVLHDSFEKVFVFVRIITVIGSGYDHLFFFAVEWEGHVKDYKFEKKNRNISLYYDGKRNPNYLHLNMGKKTVFFPLYVGHISSVVIDVKSTLTTASEISQ